MIDTNLYVNTLARLSIQVEAALRSNNKGSVEFQKELCECSKPQLGLCDYCVTRQCFLNTLKTCQDLTEELIYDENERIAEGMGEE